MDDRRFELARFSLDDVSECSAALRGLARGAGSMEEAAQGVTRYLYDHLVDTSGEPACALVRLYKTHRYGALEPDLQDFARDVLGEEPSRDVRCLTLLGTRGELPEWNDRRASRGHRAIPLPSEHAVGRLPMVSRLITQLGVDPQTVVDPPAFEQAVALSQRAYDAFHEPVALGSPYLPAQDFVREHGIASAVGFGGLLFTGDLYAVLLFSKVPVGADVAKRLKILSLAVRVPLLAFARGRVFAPSEPAGAA